MTNNIIINDPSTKNEGLTTLFAAACNGKHIDAKADAEIISAWRAILLNPDQLSDQEILVFTDIDGEPLGSKERKNSVPWEQLSKDKKITEGRRELEKMAAELLSQITVHD